MLQDGSVNKTVLLWRLNGVGPLSTELPNRALYANHTGRVVLMEQTMDGAESARATDTSATMH